MIVEYHRPTSLEEAIKLLNREGVSTRPLGGGTLLNQPSPDPLAVVDLQALGLQNLERRGHLLEIGAMVTLQALLEYPGIQPALAAAIRHEATHNLRQAATVAGSLVAAGGRSAFATAMLALDAELRAVGPGGAQELALGDLLPLRQERLRGQVITAVTIPAQPRLAYEYVARTPADLPIVCVAVCMWPSGRTRMAVGGFGLAPRLAMDGPEPGGVDVAAAEVCSQAGDAWASAAYRQETAAVLARRCLEETQHAASLRRRPAPG